MNDEQRNLYERIQAYPLDSPNAQYPFSARLASENRWSHEYTQRVIQEYKKFAFLAVAAGHPVTPSGDIDKAWHVHLTYTHEYWHRFCAEVLKVPLHHQPTAGGAQERDKFTDWYRQTLASYGLLFGQAPPADIWPEPLTRFRAAPVRRISPGEVAIIALCILAYLAVSVGIRLLVRWIEGPPPPKPTPLTPEDTALLVWFIVGFGATCIVAGALRWFFRGPSGEPDPEALDLDPYETAYLAGGEEAVRCAAVAALVGDGRLTMASAAGKLERHPEALDVADRHLMEQAVWREVDPEEGTSLEALQKNAKVPEELTERLCERGLAPGAESATIGRLLPLGLALLAPVCGLARMLGIPKCEPTAVLFLPWLIATILAFAIFGRPLHRSRRGDRALADLRTRHADLKTKFSMRDARVTSDELARGVGLFGIGILAGGPLAELYKLMKPHVNTDGTVWVWHDDADSDAGDDGGGGCGCG